MLAYSQFINYEPMKKNSTNKKIIHTLGVAKLKIVR